MIDYAKITVKGGKGGNGAGSFRRTKGKRRGKPDGGDGGMGGGVYVETTLDLNTLEPYRFVKNYKAHDGQNGSSNLRRGANGLDFVLKVPVGTVVEIEGSNVSNVSNVLNVVDRKRGFDEKPLKRLSHLLPLYHFDLVREGERILVARGGDGGRGNAKLRDEFGRRPKAGEKGTTGEACDITLELKLIADVGLIGFPNAGKSTLLAALTSAKPQIASYPFTTLEPNLGVLEAYGIVGKWDSRKKEPTILPSKYPKNLILADIPGLIEGAAKGKGLGDLFLKHIERTGMLVHLIDVSQDADHWHDYQTVRQELRAYSKELTKKKEIIVLNKTDLVSSPEAERIKRLFSKKRKKVFAISALKKEGLEELVRELIKVSKVSKVSKEIKG